MYITGGYNFVSSQNSTLLTLLKAGIYQRQFTASWVLVLQLTGLQCLTQRSQHMAGPSKNKVYRYDIQLTRWFLFCIQDDSVTWDTSSATIDPSTGLVYIPKSFVVPGTSPTVCSLLQYDAAQNKASDITVPGAPDDQMLSYSKTCSSYSRKLIVFGGKGFWLLTRLFTWWKVSCYCK